MPQTDEHSVAGRGVTRRTFLGTTILVGGAATLTGCFDGHPGSAPHAHHAAPDDALRFFTDAEAWTVDAVAARLIPGDEADPGAHEAGVVFYIDRKLADHEAFAEPTYTQGPFAQTPDEDADDGIVVSEDQLYRYGFQGADVTPKEFYRDALSGLDRFSREQFGARFAELDHEVQDQVLVVLDDIAQAAEPDSEPGDVALAQAAEDAFGDVDPGSFFETIRTDSIEGMFADPQYGGNRSMVGWALIGYPGANRGWSPEQMLTPTVRLPSSLHDMPAMNPDDHEGSGLDALEQSHEGVVEG